MDIDQPLSPASRLGSIGFEQKYSTATPTQTHRDSYAIAKEEITSVKTTMERIYNEDMKALEQKLISAGAPYTPVEVMIIEIKHLQYENFIHPKYIVFSRDSDSTKKSNATRC